MYIDSALHLWSGISNVYIIIIIIIMLKKYEYKQM